MCSSKISIKQLDLNTSLSLLACVCVFNPVCVFMCVPLIFFKIFRKYHSKRIYFQGGRTANFRFNKSISISNSYIPELKFFLFECIEQWPSPNLRWCDKKDWESKQLQNANKTARFRHPLFFWFLLVCVCLWFDFPLPFKLFKIL